MSSRSTNDKNSMADAMSEYHRDQDSSWNQKAAQSPSKAFGSWDGNKGRKAYYREKNKQYQAQDQASHHTKKKEKWYGIRDS